MKNGRRKGARAELELFGLLSAGLGPGLPLRRQLAAARDGGSDAQEHDALPTWAIEVKNVDQLARPTWWRQAIVQAEREGREPVLFYRRPLRRGCALATAWTAVVPLELAEAVFGRPLVQPERVPGPPTGCVLSFAQAVRLMKARP
jgi:hypothetical protein